MGIDIPAAFLCPKSSDRERLKRLLQQHGKVADFEFEMRRKDGENTRHAGVFHRGPRCRRQRG